jgi:trehalose utilization protein
MQGKIRVTVWNEFRHEREHEAVKKVYPNGMHVVLAEALQERGFQTRTATLDEPEHGLTEAVVNDTDVMIWWGHLAHDKVDDAIVKRVQQRVLAGMGLVVLHSGHFSKIFRALLGTNCSLQWREADERERLWNLEPGHPITQGIGDYIELDAHEMYGERFDIPSPDKLLFVSWFEGGNVFRSGCTWERGHGRIFYFSPGHETYPIYYRNDIRQVIANACTWAAPRIFLPTNQAPMVEPLEKISPKEGHFGRAGVQQKMEG